MGEPPPPPGEETPGKFWPPPGPLLLSAAVGDAGLVLPPGDGCGVGLTAWVLLVGSVLTELPGPSKAPRDGSVPIGRPDGSVCPVVG